MSVNEFEIKERAKKILEGSKINVLSGEKDLIEQLDTIINEENNEMDYNLINKTLENIEIYLRYKEKMLLTVDDYEYLVSLSKELKDQSVRRIDDIIYIPLFKITSKDGEEKYFLTRSSAKEYIELHNQWYNDDVIEVEENNNDNLLKLIQIIKRNFWN